MRVEIINTRGEKTILEVHQADAQKYGNINEYLRRDLSVNFDLVDRVQIKERNYPRPTARGYHYTITYDQKLEDFKTRRARIEITWKPGYEDFGGYGARTDGRKQRGFIGKSTGWTPIYLLILTSRSSGGASLMHEGIQSIWEL